MCSKSSPRVSIIDYGMGNLFSIRQACEYVQLSAEITSNGEDVSGSDAVILPGVGAFGDAMANLAKLGLIDRIINFIKTGKPFMGICLGMQLLFSESDEFGKHKGLDVISGSVVKFPAMDNKGIVSKVPQIGWNRIKKNRFDKNYKSWENTPLAEQADGVFMYFAHSFYAIPNSSRNLLAITDYADIEYASGIMQNNVWGFQFHPEKSGAEGLKIYKSFKNIISAGGCNG